MALDLGGILGFASGLLGGGDGLTPSAGPKPMPSRLITGTRGDAARAEGAMGILALILDGMNDSAVRAAARTARVGKKDLIDTLVRIDQVTNGTALTGVQKMFLSNEIEKIFKPRRRSVVPKSLKRSIKQIEWIKKNLKGVFR